MVVFAAVLNMDFYTRAEEYAGTDHCRARDASERKPFVLAEWHG